jgi:hypothetical protein
MEESAQGLPQNLWKTTSVRVIISPLRMNLIFENSHVSTKSDE